MLAVAGGAEKRIPKYPDVPTLMESYGFGMPSFPTVGGPKEFLPLSSTFFTRLFEESPGGPGIHQNGRKVCHPACYRNPEEATKYVQDFFAELGPVVKQLGLRKE